MWTARSLFDARLVCLQVGIVQTAYANGASTNFIRNNLGIEVAVTPTGVKYLHEEAVKFDIGIYFEANGHGTVLFSDSLLQRLTQVWSVALRLRYLLKWTYLVATTLACATEFASAHCPRTVFANTALMCSLPICLSVYLNLLAAVAIITALCHSSYLAGNFAMAAFTANTACNG